MANAQRCPGPYALSSSAAYPSAVGLIVLGQPLISLLERGAFDSTASALVYSTLSMFTLGLIVHSALEVIARSFYADKDTLTPLFAAVGGATINLLFAIVLSDVATVDASTFFNSIVTSFPMLGYTRYIGSVSGLALANSLGVMFEVLVLLIILRRRWRGIQERALSLTLVKTLTASLVMAAAIILADLVWRMLIPDSSLTMTIVRLFVEGMLGLSIFVIAALLLKMSELTELWRMIRLRPA